MRATGIKLIHRGQYLSYYEIEYTDEFGHKKTYEMVSKQGSRYNNSKDLTLGMIGKQKQAIALMILDRTHERMLLSKEFRLGVNQWVYNTIAGLIDEGETEEQAASRELWEETGLKLIRVIAKLKPTFTCAPVTDDLTTLMIVEAEGDIINSNSVYEEIESKWVCKEEMKVLIESDKVTFAGRTQALAYMWCSNIGGIK